MSTREPRRRPRPRPAARPAPPRRRSGRIPATGDGATCPPGVAADATCCGTRRSAPAATPATSSPAARVLRIADADGDACVHLVVHHARATAERLNVADTVKVQWQAYLGAGAVLLSDMGRVLMTIVGRHQRPPRRPVRRHRARAVAAGRYGDERHPLGRRRRVRELLTVAAAKHGLDAARHRRPASTCSSGASSPTTARCASTATPRPGTARRAARRARRHRDAGQRAPPARRPRRRTRRRTVRLHRVAAPAPRARRPLARRPRPSASGPTRTPTTASPGGAPMSVGRSTRSSRPGPPWSGVVAGRPHAAHRRPRRQPGRRLPALRRRTTRPSATRPPTRSPPRATSSSSPAPCCAPTRAAR